LPLIELSSLVILHQFSSPEWLKYIQKGVIALQDLTAGQLNRLQKGQAYIWSREASHHEFETRTVKVDIRPRVTKHGGETVKAVK
jgi:DNA phosphorothioation-dependent restriction protein DptH